jgi:hypothetical protein
MFKFFYLIANMRVPTDFFTADLLPVKVQSISPHHLYPQTLSYSRKSQRLRICVFDFLHRDLSWFLASAISTVIRTSYFTTINFIVFLVIQNIIF